MDQEQLRESTDDAAEEPVLEPTVLGPASELTEENGEAVLDKDNVVWGNF